MTDRERIRAIELLGYTEQQAAFLCLVALHGGCFLRRQYKEFRTQGPGGSGDGWIERARAHGHIRTHESIDRTLIYQLVDRLFYRLIDAQDDCNRRWRQPYSVKVRLMGLDFVLAHPEHQYLATEAEKLQYFCEVLHIDRACLPSRIYRSRKHPAAVTVRYFGEQFPLFLCSARDTPQPAISFCYVEGARGLPSRFDMYLNQYRHLFSRLPTLEVIYVASSPARFSSAQRSFGRLCGAVGHAACAPLARRLLDHFRARQLFERRESAGFDKTGLDRLRDELEEFSTPKYQALYRSWQREGDVVLTGAPVNDGQRHSFSTWHVSNDYTFLGDFSPVTAA